MLQYVFSRADPGRFPLITIDSLSQKNLLGSLRGTPNMRNFYFNPSNNSVALFKAIKSEPNIKLYIVSCFLEYHNTDAILQ